MHAEILKSLTDLEQETGARVLYACESGSRAWGFASRDSDWDVRFFFVWPEETYLRVHPPQDHLHRDLPGDLDITGWDLRKALHHLAKSSASVLEWLRSPQVYLERGSAAAKMRQLSAACFQPRSTVHHYLGLARQLWGQAGEGASLNGKKVLYVLRATLCARWILDHKTPPPVPFADLLSLIPDAALLEEILAFLALKSTGTETDCFPVSEALRDCLSELRGQCDTDQQELPQGSVDVTPLDHFFQSMLSSPP